MNQILVGVVIEAIKSLNGFEELYRFKLNVTSFSSISCQKYTLMKNCSKHER